MGLLLPLAEVLGVSVTELLLCRRDAAPDPETAEAAVRTALAYGEELPRAWREKGRWRLLFLLSALIGGLCALLLARMGRLTESTVLALGFGGGFGAYFTFWAPLRLPRYYDENPLSAWSDGPFRMNLPGVRFTNGNWPHILRCIRLWSCGCLAVLPALSLALGAFPFRASLERRAFPVPLLGGTLPAGGHGGTEIRIGKRPPAQPEGVSPLQRLRCTAMVARVSPSWVRMAAAKASSLSSRHRAIAVARVFTAVVRAKGAQGSVMGSPLPPSLCGRGQD